MIERRYISRRVKITFYQAFKEWVSCIWHDSCELFDTITSLPKSYYVEFDEEVFPDNDQWNDAVIKFKYDPVSVMGEVYWIEKDSIVKQYSSQNPPISIPSTDTPEITGGHTDNPHEK